MVESDDNEGGEGNDNDEEDDDEIGEDECVFCYLRWKRPLINT